MREMKDSGVEWIGKIPKDWEIVPLTKQLDSIVDYRGKTPEKTEEGTFLVTAKNIKDGKICYELSKEYVREADYEEIMHRGIPQIGDILFTTEAPLGQVANVDRTDIALAQRIIKFRALSTVNNYYLKYWMLNEGFQQFLHSLSTGSTATGIKSSKLFLLPLVRPNIEQQNKIVEYLDAKCSKIDEIVEKQKVIIEKLEEYKLSIITEAVTSGINPDVEMKDSGSVWFGNIPINWEMKRLKYVFHIQKDIAGEEGHTVLSITQRGREAVDGRYGKDANRVLRAIDSAEKDCGIRLLEADPKAEGVIGSRVLPKGWVARKPSDIYWNGIRTFGIFCDYGLSIPEYVSLAVKLKEQKSVSRLGNRNDDAEENDKDDSDAGDIGNIRFWNLPIYHDDWRDNLTIELTQEEAFYLDKQIQKSTKGSLLEYVLKNHIDLNEYDDFASLTAELSEKVSEKLAYMMKLACDFNNLVYMARVRYNVMLSEDENTYANDEWSRLLPDIRHNATVDLDAVFGEFQLINPRAKSFLCGIQAAFITLDIDMADELIRKRERSLKGAARAKLSRTKEFDHSKWVGGGMLDYRFSNARRIVNDIYSGEVSADV